MATRLRREFDIESAAWQPYEQLLVLQAERTLATKYDPVGLERDKWLYEQRQHQNTDWLGILTEFKKVRPDKKWRPLSTINGIRSAAKRYADEFGLPFRKSVRGRRAAK
jgi:hypothetical protein